MFRLAALHTGHELEFGRAINMPHRSSLGNLVNAPVSVGLIRNVNRVSCGGINQQATVYQLNLRAYSMLKGVMHPINYVILDQLPI